MLYWLRSIRRRIIALSLLLSVLLLGAVLHTEQRLRGAAARSQEVMAQQQTFAAGIAALKNTVYFMEGGLYRYAVLQDDSARVDVERLLGEIEHPMSELLSSALLDTDEVLHQMFGALMETLRRADKDVRDLLQVIATLDKHFPASPIITGRLFPLNVAFITALDEAIVAVEVEADASEARDLQRVLYELRYLWSQQISLVRMYIANRSGVFGSPEADMRQQLQTRHDFMQEIRRHLATLRREADTAQRGLLAEQVGRMQQLAADYETQFGAVVDIYESGAWRGDIVKLRNVIQPSFAKVRRGFDAVEARLGVLGATSMMSSLQLAEEITGFLWRVTAVLMLLLLLAYLAYEFSIRRPIDQVVMALRALGKGEAYTPLLRTRTYETETLLRSFREMQNQVNAREMRLRAILENASEGIITIDAQGIIETFNGAAETMFGYTAEEVIGKNVNVLMPHPMREEHDGYLRRYLETGERRIIGAEVNVSAQRKDGVVFPMSIKVSEMTLDGERHFTAVVADISERKAMLDHLRQLAEQDSLTGLYNRHYFTTELERVIQRSLRQHGIDCALLYIDLDNFKFVNDTLGHLAGDRVLIEVAGLLTKRTRKSDMIARLGGDEFAVLLYDVDVEQALATAENYRQLLADYNFRHEGRVVDIGCSIGLAMFGADITSREELMARADIACHMAKRAGRNSVHLYEASDRANMDTMFADMGWARRIKQAIEQGSFVFALQPIVSIPQRAVVSHELLLRMRGENGEIIMPSGFMPSAERFGLILEIDRWVVRQAIRLLAKNVVEPGTRLSVNLSAMAIGDNEVLRLLTTGLTQHGVAAQRLTFEITETIAMADLSAAADFLARLQALGCATALDDFGVGYSSFAYLKDLPVDYVKIDGSFVRDIAKDSVQLALVKSMNEIAHAMGKKTVAEYVDDDAVLRLLDEIGVDFAQGYLTGRPRLVDVTTDL